MTTAFTGDKAVLALAREYFKKQHNAFCKDDCVMLKGHTIWLTTFELPLMKCIPITSDNYKIKIDEAVSHN